MKIAACISAGNTEKLTEGCIEHHRALGVDQFIILHINSYDRTPEILREIAQTSSDVEVIFGSADNQFNQNGQLGFVEYAKKATNADWILRIDSDERWFVESGSLKSALETASDEVAISVPRYNIVWDSPDRLSEALTHRPLDLKDIPLAVFPVDTFDRHLDDLGGVPWVITRIAPKSIMRNTGDHVFTMGGHTVKSGHDADDPVKVISRPDLFITQLAFTDFANFQNRTKWLSEWTHKTKSWRSAGTGWHWDRLGKLYAAGDQALLEEFRQQFLTPEQARRIAGHEVIVPGETVFDIQRRLQSH